MCLYSSLLALLLSLLFLLLREGINHQEGTVLGILLRLKIVLMLLRHEDSPFESLHHWDVNVGLIFLFTLDMGSCKVVPNRLDLLELLQTSGVCSILRDEVELL